MAGRRWTTDEDERLTWLWGIKSLERIADELDRTPRAVYMRGRHLELGGWHDGHVTLAEISRQTGYCHKALHNMARRLGIRLRGAPSCWRLSSSPRAKIYRVSKETADALVDGLKGLPGVRVMQSVEGQWGGHKPDACRRCERADRPHEGRGLCSPCYQTAKRHGDLERYPLARERKNREGEQ